MLKPILLVEDNAADRELIILALERCRIANPLVIVHDGEEALDYLFRQGAWAECKDDMPAFVLLDKKLPKIDGHEVLAAIRKNHPTAVLPVVMLTSSQHELDLMKSYDLGVNAYVVKPIEFADFMDAIQDIGMFWALLNESSVGATRPLGTPLEVISIDPKSHKVTVEKRDGDGPPEQK